ncbi:MAG: IPT/TIG domain-containing protein [Ardenticatenaceae bacterium]|nr:IPT/TIG domain-containing protein [Anaerolineales bacterium]MCB8938313.1 IPT/TIG domain-containing protein [Ardenticatenaceae bacterium]MCB8975678.1 IPT/TIG domain-containing protein [Ardenticatenaceae bacterium]
MRQSLTQKIILLFFLLLFVGGSLVSGLNPTPVEAQANTPTPSATPSIVVSSVQPSSVSNLADTELVITGSGFVDGAVVVLSGLGGLNTTFVSSSLLRANLPAGTAPGGYSITVINPNATSATLNNALTVTAPAGPTSTPVPTNTPAPTAFVRPLLVVNSYGASSAEITPGENLAFEMTIANAGQSRATNVVATFIAGSFTARDTGGVQALGTIDPSGTVRFWQPLAASRDLAGQSLGTLEVKVDYTDVNGTPYSETFALTFPIKRAATGGAAATATPTATPTATATSGPVLRPQLLVTGYEIDQDQLQPGMGFTLSLTVQNQGNSEARRVTMILGGGSTSGGTVDGTPVPGGGLDGAGGDFGKFAPVGASNVQTLGNLAEAGNLQTSMALIVNAATEPGAYPVKVSFVYTDERNNSYEDDQVITLLVYKRPSVAMSFYTPVFDFFIGQPGSLPLQLVNSGRSTAVFGNFSVTAEGATFENNSFFVGTLDPGGFFPLDAIIYPEVAGPLDLLLSVNYTDDFNQPQVLTQTLTINVMEAFFPEEPFEPFPDENIPEVVVEPETFGQKVWRFVLGLLGLSSGVPQPAQPDFGVPSEFPVDGEGGSFEGPIEGPVQVVPAVGP